MKRFFLVALCAAALVSAADAQNAVSKVKDGVNRTYDNVSEGVSRGLDVVAERVAPFKLGVQAGFNASNFSPSIYDAKAGFNVGLTAIFDASELLPNTYVRTGLLFQRKGARVKSEVKGFEDTRIRSCYLEVPARYGYSFLLNQTWTLMAETGPYVALGVGGRVREQGFDENDAPDGTYSYSFFGEGDARRFDFGWGLHMGALLKQNHQILLGWDFGFANLYDGSYQNRNFSLSYAYYFF